MSGRAIDTRRLKGIVIKDDIGIANYNLRADYITDSTRKDQIVGTNILKGYLHDNKIKLIDPSNIEASQNENFEERYTPTGCQSIYLKELKYNFDLSKIFYVTSEVDNNNEYNNNDISYIVKVYLNEEKDSNCKNLQIESQQKNSSKIFVEEVNQKNCKQPRHGNPGWKVIDYTKFAKYKIDDNKKI